MLNKVEIIKKLEAVNVDYPIEDCFYELRDIASEYQIGEELFDAYIDDDDWLAEMAVNEIQRGGFERLLFFLNGLTPGDFYNCDISRINAYGNLEVVTLDDMRILQEELIDLVNDLEGDGDD